MSNQQLTSEYNDEHLSVSVSRQHGSQVKLHITVAPAAVDASYEKAVKNVNNEVSLPGFRKGKAPKETIVKKYQAPIMKEWRQLLLQTGLNDALKLTKLHPFKNDSLRCTEMSELVKNQPATIVIEFEGRPEVPKINLEEIRLPHLEAPQINPENVGKVMTDLRLYNAKWEDVTDRGIEEGDFTDLEIDNLDTGEKICTDNRFEVKSGSIPNWMRELIQGKLVNESIEGQSKNEERPSLEPYEQEEIEPEFKPTHVRIRVKAIKKPILPELNDEFAKKTGAENISDLEVKVKADLVHRAKNKLLNHLMKLLDEQLLNKYQFDVPASIVKSEAAQRLANQTEWMRSQNAPEQEIQKMVAELEQHLPEEVEKGCRLLFLLLDFAQENKIDLTQEELNAELTKQITYGLIGKDEDPNYVRSKVAQGLLMRKAREYIIEDVLSHHRH